MGAGFRARARSEIRVGQRFGSDAGEWTVYLQHMQAEDAFFSVQQCQADKSKATSRLSARLRSPRRVASSRCAAIDLLTSSRISYLA